MTSPDYRSSEAPSEMLDLYDVLPGTTRPTREDDPATAIIRDWRDLLHVLVSFVVTTFSFSVAVSWAFTGPGGISYWFWSRYLPDSDTNGVPALLGFPGHSIDVAFNTAVGAIFLLTTPVVLKALVRLNAAIACGLIVDEASALRQQVSELTQSRTAAAEAEVHTLRWLRPLGGPVF